MSYGIRFDLNDSLSLRDPQDTELGRKIIENAILLIDKLGFEAFTFKKLAAKIESTESSIYRYFDNKHMLLLFLTSWYWEWLNYLIISETKNISDSEKKIKILINIMVRAKSDSAHTPYVNEALLHEIMVKEGAKSYHTSAVDEENRSGLFASYKELVETISQLLLDHNPTFPYAHSLASNMFEMANNQIFFAEHLPKLTDVKSCQDDFADIIDMMEYFVFKILS